MKLNKDCVRDVLMYLETADFYQESDGEIDQTPIFMDQICENLLQWSKLDIFYSLKHMEEAGLIDATMAPGECEFAVSDISFYGHEFLESIKDTTQWKKVNKVLDSVKNYSLEAIKAVASGVTEAAITSCIVHTP